MRRISVDRWVLRMIAVGAVLLLSNLGNGRLWQDEAETAVLGRNILHDGYPSAFDGVNRLNPSLPVQAGSAWTYHTWLPMYAAAASFLVAGPTTAAARFPFALMGAAAIWLGYLAARRLTGDRTVARLTTFLLVTSVPFLLHMRQCRYYAPAVLFTLWSVLAYWRFIRLRPWAVAELICAGVLLFHAEHGAFAPVFLALGIHHIFTQKGRIQRRRGITAAVILLALTVPWVIYLHAEQHHRAFALREISHHFQFYFRQINRFLFPIVPWILLLIPWRPIFKNLFGAQGTTARQGWNLMGILFGGGFLFLILLPEQRHFRYLVFLIPFLLVFHAALLARMIRAKRWLGVVLAGLLIFTPDVSRIRCLFLEFIGELTHPYRGPMDGIVELLQKESRAGETLKTPYEEHPILFYTPSLGVEPLEKSEDFARETFPDWIVLRRDWLPHGFFDSPYYRQIQARYQEVLLDAPDIPWQNRPDPGYHRFRTDLKASRVIVFHRK